MFKNHYRLIPQIFLRSNFISRNRSFSSIIWIVLYRSWRHGRMRESMHSASKQISDSGYSLRRLSNRCFRECAIVGGTCKKH